jgi:hypothetical protein
MNEEKNMEKSQKVDRVNDSSPAACSACEFWVGYVDGNGKETYGECHRFPPVMQRVPSVRHKDLFPAMFDWVKNWSRPDRDDSCGEFKPKKVMSGNDN